MDFDRGSKVPNPRASSSSFANQLALELVGASSWGLEAAGSGRNKGVFGAVHFPARLDDGQW